LKVNMLMKSKPRWMNQLNEWTQIAIIRQCENVKSLRMMRNLFIQGSVKWCPWWMVSQFTRVVVICWEDRGHNQHFTAIRRQRWRVIFAVKEGLWLTIESDFIQSRVRSSFRSIVIRFCWCSKHNWSNRLYFVWVDGFVWIKIIHLSYLMSNEKEK
jgi:hypothetical protein